mgnify:CR=1 FL=1
MVAATIRKIHAPNQLAAVFEVSGSPDENLEYTFTPPDKADNGADGVNQLGSRGSKYEVPCWSLPRYRRYRCLGRKPPIEPAASWLPKRNLFFHVSKLLIGETKMISTANI